MAKIPEGEFLMGSYYGEEDELPDHLSTLNSFSLMCTKLQTKLTADVYECERGTGGFDTFDSQQPVVYVDWKNAVILL